MSGPSKNIEIYHFENTYKFYLYCEIIEDRRPSVGLPAHSTDIRPPLQSCPEGHIPVFNGSGWHIVPNTFWRPKVIEKNYDAGRSMSSYAPMSLSIYSNLFPRYPSMPMLCNSLLVVQAICQKTKMIHAMFNQILNFHRELISHKMDPIPLDCPKYNELASTPTSLYRYKLEAESMIFLMRRVIDSLVQLTYLLTNYSDFQITRAIKYDGISQFLDIGNPSTDIEKIIVGDNEAYKSDQTDFFWIINDLFNSFKHCLMHDESYELICPELPTITSYQAIRNKHANEIIYHNHNAYHLIMGFQDNVARILANQREYVLSHPSSIDGE